MSRAKFNVTDDLRRQAETLAGLGLPLDMIARVIGCSTNTLTLYFEKELKDGEAKATAQVAKALYSKAIGGDVASMIFWLKVRAKWSEKVTLEHTGPGGGPIQSVGITTNDPIEAAKAYQQLINGT